MRKWLLEHPGRPMLDCFDWAMYANPKNGGERMGGRVIVEGEAIVIERMHNTMLGLYELETGLYYIDTD